MEWQILAERVLGNEVPFSADIKLLTQGVKGLIGAWRLGVLHVEYERLKKIQQESDWKSI